MTLALPLAPAMRVYWMRTSAIAAFKTQCMQCYLSSSELQRMQRLIFENDKLDFLASRVLLRGVLAQLQGCSPHEVAFGTSPFGKLIWSIPDGRSNSICRTRAEHRCWRSAMWVPWGLILNGWSGLPTSSRVWWK